MPVRVGPQAQTLPRPGRPVAPNAGYRKSLITDFGDGWRVMRGRDRPFE